MPLALCPLASGSLGNALLVSSAKTRLLVDMGISRRRLNAALSGLGAAADQIAAVLITHTHRDHFSASAAAFCLWHRIPVYSTAENLEHLACDLEGFADLLAEGLARPMDGGSVKVGDVKVEPFEVPHDAAGQCLGFRISSGPARARQTAAVATDLGHVPGDCLATFADADAVVLESNHDPDLLWSSGRPPDLIARIAGHFGHLSNAAAAEALAEIVGRSPPGRLRHVVLAHLSRDCNTPRLALAAQAHLARRHTHPVRVAAAAQYEAGPVIQL